MTNEDNYEEEFYDIDNIDESEFSTSDWVDCNDYEGSYENQLENELDLDEFKLSFL